jgi:hypothetical protein
VSASEANAPLTPYQRTAGDRITNELLELVLSKRPRTLGKVSELIPWATRDYIRALVERPDWRSAGVCFRPDISYGVIAYRGERTFIEPKLALDVPPTANGHAHALAAANGHTLVDVCNSPKIGDDEERELDDVEDREPAPPPDKQDPLKVKLLGKQRKQLGLLWRLRTQAGQPRIGVDAWLSSLSIDLSILYDPEELGDLAGMTIAEDEYFGCEAAGRSPMTRVILGKRQVVRANKFFDRLVPPGETRDQRKKRRRAFHRRLDKAVTMKNEHQEQSYIAPPRGDPAGGRFTPTADRAGRLAALLKALPPAEKAITVAHAAKRVRSHPAWQAKGKPMTPRSLKVLIWRMRTEHPDKIGSEWSTCLRIWRL